MTRQDFHVAIVEADFYPEITKELSIGSTKALEQAGATYEHVRVPGVFEIPSAIRLCRNSSTNIEGFVALGCVIRGETNHYDIVAQLSAYGLMQLALEGVLLGNGILTVDNHEQAVIRSSEKDRGGDAARACLCLLKIRAQQSGKS